MRIFKIAGPVLEGKYQGTGYAIGAIAKGQLIDFRYLSEVLDLSGDEGPEEIMQYLADARLGPTVRYMQALGEVSVGMCSCYEFVEL